MKSKPSKLKCIDCASTLNLYEIDFEKKRKILQCSYCGLYHLYKVSFFGKWKLKKAGRVSDFWGKSKK